MKSMAILTALAVLATLTVSCGGGRGKVPEERPGDFSVRLMTRAYPTPAPDVLVTLWSDGTGNYQLVFPEPHPGVAQGPFQATPEQVDEVFAAVHEAKFFKLDSEYISDPPIPGRGVDELVVSAGGQTALVRSEYAEVPAMDLIRSAIMKVIPPEAYEGGSRVGDVPGYVVDKLSKLIYHAGSPEVADIPEENRIPFKSIYEALDAGFHPAPSTREFKNP